MTSQHTPIFHFIPEQVGDMLWAQDDSDDDCDYLGTSETNCIIDAIDDKPNLVEKGLFIGSSLAEQNREVLLEAGVTHVLQVAEGVIPTYNTDFEYKKIHVQDFPSEDIVAHFPKCFEFIDEAIDTNGAVLVHCVAGVSRSAAVCVGYLMCRRGMRFDAALAAVQAVRPWICLNEGFKLQLRELECLGCDLGKWRAWRHVSRERKRELGHCAPGAADLDDGELVVYIGKPTISAKA